MASKCTILLPFVELDSGRFSSRSALPHITAITTALPTVTRELDGEENYVWIANAYTLASAAIQPLVGQISNIVGRRYPMIVSMCLFALGSGLCGGSTSAAMMIAGRAVQGLGAGGILLLLEVIVSDLVPVRERAQFVGIALSTCALGTSLGPLVGGALVQHASWRWVFYINLPFAGLALVALVLFLNVKHQQEASWRRAVARVDWVGNAIFIAASCAIMYALVIAGSIYSWSSSHVLLPLILGSLGLVLFLAFETSPYCLEPTMPPRLFCTRTSMTAYILAFLAAMLLQWVVYFLALFFQSVQGQSTTMSGVDVIPLTGCLIPSAILGGVIMGKTGVYRPLHLAGFALLSLSLGLFSTWNATTPRAEWVVLQCLAGVGHGLLLTSLLPAIQGALPETDNAVATAAYAFLRSFGFVWGVAVPAAVFNDQVDRFVSRVSDLTVRNQLAHGGAYALAGTSFVSKLGADASTVLGVYTDSLRTVWLVGMALALLGFVLVGLERHIELRPTLETDFGLEEVAAKAEDGVIQTREPNGNMN
ncbi:putative MFS multidrug transporter [Aspergillus clavatus NRRL 1]|uniref:MFS multidrug transporter, putative n=1 Tax=Aspergillus clavatus (strain ATCC 1007 / CBS 513.65 / DSM 816 / NCTC 3887 / NRRL 1 / QM 1276 / 107) TaxID=344612 RepID=A1CGF9_ASPCL|nr:MFS multidrug transporter, putative [Aspergillus clavatus NRRL 1]EAW11039.1 MFS multidrug transporter, putative [Aspergillus clavatus NRRL 1]